MDNDPEKLVCVCNEHSCGDLDFDWPTKANEAFLVQSTLSGRRFESSDLTNLEIDHRFAQTKATYIRVDLDSEHQSILGWGGAFTDSTGENLNNLSRNLSVRLIESYYGKNGLQYNFGRVPIGGTDFSPRPYSYDDSDGPDYNLTQWSLAEEDHTLKIPWIKEALKIAKSAGTDIKLFGSPWTPPIWMKSSNSFVRGHLINEDRIYRSYTNYLMKFYDAYEKNGIHFWGATVQNEPISSFLPYFYFFNSLQYNNEEYIRFITKYLGPALEARGWTKDKFKLMVGDDSLGFVNFQIPAIFRNPEVQKYVSGVAFHWYTSGNLVTYDHLKGIYEGTKDKVEFVLMTEACKGSARGKKVDLGSWDRGEAYALDIIEDLNRGTSGWIDWNMALNLQGGPSWAKNMVDSPIIVDADKNEFYKQPMYYALAHFSRLFKAGSVQVDAKVKRGAFGIFSKSKVMVAAVVNRQTGHLVVNILNTSRAVQKIQITVAGSKGLGSSQQLKSFTVEGKSVNSVVLKLGASQ